MPLFVAQHQHSPETCPASAGSRLLSQISAAAAARHGVTIEAEALIDGEHRLLLILDAADQQAVGAFLAPLRDSGELRVLPASTAEDAVRRGGCATAPQPEPAAHR
jgi:hypothetical protein